MNHKFDLIAIGTGAAASAAASRCRAAGWQVALVDSLPFGGTCALRGCDPKKVLVGAAEATDWARRMRGKGVGGEQVTLDWPALIRFKRTFTEPVPAQREASLAKAGIAAFHGRARFVGPSAIQVGDDRLEGRFVLIATGQKPAVLNIPGVEHLTYSDQFLDLSRLPQRIVFIGGGYIAFEFAHVALRAGSHVTILQRGPRPLPRFDPDLVGPLVQHTRGLGADIQLESEATGIDTSRRQLGGALSASGRTLPGIEARTPSDQRERPRQKVASHSAGLIVRASTARGPHSFAADMVVHAAGREPDLDDLELDVAGVQRDPRGIRVNGFLQSVSNPAIYAAGDAAASAGPPLTPVAAYDGLLAAANMIAGNHETANYLGVPTVVFTIPSLASVGLSESSAREQGLAFHVKQQMTTDWYQSRRIAEACSGFKVLVDDQTGHILGAHLLGDGAEDTINLFALAMRSGLRATDLKHQLFAYPTHASDVPYML